MFRACLALTFIIYGGSVFAQSDLSVLKSGFSCGADANCSTTGDNSATQVQPGQTIQYNVNYTNTSGEAAGVILADDVPADTCLNLSSLNPLPGTALQYSSNNGTSYDYFPTPDSNGQDCSVTNFRFVFQTAVPALASFWGESSTPISCNLGAYHSGNGQAITLPRGGSLPNIQHIWSFCAWVKPELNNSSVPYATSHSAILSGTYNSSSGFVGNTKVVFQKDGNNSGKFIFGRFNNWLFTDYGYNNVYSTTSGPSGEYSYATSRTYPANEWVHLCVTTQPTPAHTRIYVNGQLESENALRYIPLFTGSQLEIGRGTYFNGLLYTRAISPGDVLDIYRGRNVSRQDLFAYWPLQKNTNDISGNNRHATAVGAALIPNPGDQPQCNEPVIENLKARTCQSAPSGQNYPRNTFLRFDGTYNSVTGASADYDKVVIAHDDRLSFGDSTSDTAFTLSAWANLKNLNANTLVLKSSGTHAIAAANQYEYKFGLNSSGQLGLTLYDQDGNNFISKYTTANVTSYLNAWHHYAATYSGCGNASCIKIYIDGSEVVATTTSASGTYSSMHNTKSNIFLGSLLPSDQTDVVANMDLANVAIFNSARSVTQVSDDYNRQYPLLNDPELLTYFPLNDYPQVALVSFDTKELRSYGPVKVAGYIYGKTAAGPQFILASRPLAYANTAIADSGCVPASGFDMSCSVSLYNLSAAGNYLQNNSLSINSADTISIWFKNSNIIDPDTSSLTLARFTAAGLTYNLTLGASSAAFDQEVITLSSSASSTVSATFMRKILRSKWQHLVLVWNSTRGAYDFYLNNVALPVQKGNHHFQGNAANHTPQINSLTALQLGVGASVEYFGDVKIFDRPVSRAEVSSLYNNSLNTDANLKLHWNLVGGALTDLSGNSNNASIVGTPALANAGWNYISEKDHPFSSGTCSENYGAARKTLPGALAWNTLSISANIPAGATTTFSILDGNSNAVISGYANIPASSFPLNISGVAAASIKLQINSTPNSSGQYGVLNSWTATYNTSTAPSFSYTTKLQSADLSSLTVANIANINSSSVDSNSGNNSSTYNLNVVFPSITGVIGDLVFDDLNNNGIYDLSDVGIEDVELSLYTDTNQDGDLDVGEPLVATTLTDSAGQYLFTNVTLNAGGADTYFIVKVTDQYGALFGRNNSSANSEGVAVTISTSSNTFSNADFGYFKPGMLGDYVWYDSNGDGLQGGNEYGLAGVRVELYTDVDVLASSTITNGNGNYKFENIAPGSYYLQFIPPSTNYQFTESLVAGGEGIFDSDVNLSGRTNVFDIAGSESNYSLDAGLYIPGSLPDEIAQPASYVNRTWYDSNQNGIQDVAEPGLAGVRVELYKSGDLLATTISDANGAYNFHGLETGKYYLKFIPLSDYSFSPQDQGSDEELDSDAITLDGTTTEITLLSGDSNINVDAGFYLSSGAPASIGNRIWFDADQDGIQDAAEVTGVSGVVFKLYRNGNYIGEGITSNTGAYAFYGLPADTYQIKFEPLDGFLFTDQDLGGNDTVDSDVHRFSGYSHNFNLTASSNITNLDAGLILGGGGLASVGDFVWLDLNANGIQDPSESGIDGTAINVVLNLYDTFGAYVGTTTANSSGRYIFSGILPGRYFIKVVMPAGYALTEQYQGSDITKDSNINTIYKRTDHFAITLQQTITNFDIGIFPTGTIGNLVFSDNNGNGFYDSGLESGIGGVELALYRDQNQDGLLDSGDSLYTKVVTNSAGNYSFNEVPVNHGSGTAYYIVQVTDSYAVVSDLHETSSTADASLDNYARTAAAYPVQLTALSPTNNRIDFGYQGDLSTVRGQVWYDTNTNGLHEENTPIAGVRVKLYTAGTESYIVDYTDSNGFYQFDNVLPGDYVVVLYATYAVSPKDQGSDDTLDSDFKQYGDSDAFTLTGSEPSNLMVKDAGLYTNSGGGGATASSVGDIVWLDTNNNGEQNPGEYGVSQVAVKLYNSADVLIGSTTTDPSGKYLFYGVPAGDYYLEFLPGNSYTFTSQNAGSENSDSDVNVLNGKTEIFTIVEGVSNFDLDAGLVIAGGLDPAVVEGFVWFDRNVDKIQSDGETGITGVGVKLYRQDGSLADYTLTNGSGIYTFRNVVPGNYYIDFDTLSGMLFTVANSGSDDTIDSDANQTNGVTSVFAVGSGVTETSVDAGLRFSVGDPANLQGLVWNDINYNGVRDSLVGSLNTRSGSLEPVIAGVKVDLYDNTGTFVATDYTNASGIYKFLNLIAGDYYVDFELPDPRYVFSPRDSGTDSADSDVNRVTGRTFLITLTSGLNLAAVDAGMATAGSIGDLVFKDHNHDGILNEADFGIYGATVSLYRDVNKDSLLDSGDTIITTVSTDANGNYSFDNLAVDDGSGSYSYFVTIDNGGSGITGLAAGLGSDGYAVVLSLDNPQVLLADFAYSPPVVTCPASDVDGDGIPNSADTDVDGDGLPNSVEGNDDTDGDGIVNSYDSDSDQDGITDYYEVQSSFGFIALTNVDFDLDGLDDAFDTTQSGSALVPVDTDGDNAPDYLDTDSDNDDTNDNIESQAASAYIPLLLLDSDCDGLDDAYDPSNAGVSIDGSYDGDDNSVPDYREVPGACSNVNLVSKSFEMDGLGVKLMEETRRAVAIRSSMGERGQCPVLSESDRKRFLRNASDDYVTIWGLSWSFPAEHVTCEYLFSSCTETSVTNVIEQNYSSSKQMRKRIRKILSGCEQSPRVKARLRRANNLVKTMENAAAAMPNPISSCQ